MKFRVLAGAAISAVLAGSAFAADMPLKAPPPVLAYDWSGFYIGGVIGGGWSHVDSSDPGLGLIGTLINVPVIQTTTGSGFIGGIEGGDRYQFGKLVVGWEADMTWGNINGTSTTNFGPTLLGIPPGLINFTRTIGANEKWTGTATSSVGIAHDRWLIYGKAGVAWAHFDYTDNWNLNIAGLVNFPIFAGTGSENRVGWTVGTGIEWAIWNNWSVKAEYDYLDFGNRTVAINGTVLPGTVVAFPASFGLENTIHVNQFKAGLNWHIAPNIW
jgi:outer membrane immunogenic protein